MGNDKKLTSALKAEAIKRVPKTDPNALRKIQARTKGKGK